MTTVGQIPTQALEKTEQSTSQQPRGAQPKFKYLCWSKSIQLNRNALKTTKLKRIGWTTIRNHVFTSTKGMQKLRSKPKPPPKMEKSPQQMKCSSTLSQIGQVRYVLFASSCQTHGDVDHSLLPWQLLAKFQHRLWKRLNGPHLHNQGAHNQNSNIYVDLNPSN